MKTLISGASGLVGSALVEHLFTHGQTIHCLQRHRQGEQIWISPNSIQRKQRPLPLPPSSTSPAKMSPMAGGPRQKRT